MHLTLSKMIIQIIMNPFFVSLLVSYSSLSHFIHVIAAVPRIIIYPQLFSLFSWFTGIFSPSFSPSSGVGPSINSSTNELQTVAIENTAIVDWKKKTENKWYGQYNNYYWRWGDLFITVNNSICFVLSMCVCVFLDDTASIFNVSISIPFAFEGRKEKMKLKEKTL